MTSPQHILPHLYEGGWSACMDFPKYFHMFRTCESEYPYLGLQHPTTGKWYYYARLPMGTRQSPAGSGRIGNAFLRMIIETNPCFQGTPVDNSLVGQLLLKLHTPSFGEGWVLLDEEGIPCVLPWLHVDDLLLHGPTLSKTTAALNFVMDEALRVGLICQAKKTVLPCQQLCFCSFLYDTGGIPSLSIPEDKISRAVSFIDYLLQGTTGRLARLSVAMVVGVLQSLVEATPGNIVASFLQGVYLDLHALEDPLL